MDELKMNLRTKIMRGIVSKLVSKWMSGKFGFDVNLYINKIELETVDGKVCIRADINAEIGQNDLIDAMKSHVDN